MINKVMSEERKVSDALNIAVRQRLDHQEGMMRKLFAYGYYKACDECAERRAYTLKECIKRAMQAAGLDPNDHPLFKATEKYFQRLENDARL